MGTSNHGDHTPGWCVVDPDFLQGIPALAVTGAWPHGGVLLV